MQRGGRGSIVNVASIAAVMGVGSSIAYAASKGAMVTMTLSLARALGPEIRVNAVCPGFIQGEWLQERHGRRELRANEEVPGRHDAAAVDDDAGYRSRSDSVFRRGRRCHHRRNADSRRRHTSETLRRWRVVRTVGQAIRASTCRTCLSAGGGCPCLRPGTARIRRCSSRGRRFVRAQRATQIRCRSRSTRFGMSRSSSSPTA